MAKYVLVAFENDNHAQSFIGKMKSATEAGKPYGVAGVFQKPTSWCECERIPDSRLTTELTRGKKFGLTMHRTCRKPRKTAQRPINLLGGQYIFQGTRVEFNLGENGEILRNFPLSITKDSDG